MVRKYNLELSSKFLNGAAIMSEVTYFNKILLNCKVPLSILIQKYCKSTNNEESVLKDTWTEKTEFILSQILLNPIFNRSLGEQNYKFAHVSLSNCLLFCSSYILWKRYWSQCKLFIKDKIRVSVLKKLAVLYK